MDRHFSIMDRHHFVTHAAVVLLISIATLLGLNSHAVAQDAAVVDDGPVYRVGTFRVRYLRENPDQPDIADLLASPVALGRIDSGFVAPRDGVELVALSLAEHSTVEPFHASALQAILESLSRELVGRDLLGINVRPDATDIDRGGIDLRGDDTALDIVIATGIVTELRTIAGGERVNDDGPITPDTTINHPLHARHIANSPVRPGRAGGTTDVLRRSELDRYLFHLGRHPGRLVEAHLSASEEVGGVVLDYQVTENDPLVIYAQVSNTGTQSTGYLRERFGLLHTQLSESDDTLSIDFSTAEFDEVNTLFASYERPFAQNDRLEWKVFGTWSEYTAEDVGFFGDDFSGKTWSVGAELIWNFHQDRDLFVDAIGGIRYDSIEVNNAGFFIRGEEQFLIPYVGMRLDHTSEWFSTQAALMLEFQAGLPDVEEANLVRLGRTDPDDTWQVLRWDGTHSFYLEPVIDRVAWEDPTTPESSTLAHEVLLAFRGQYAFDNRLIPQAERVVGGLYTVRGYPESAVAGDSVVIASAEYRYHLPRAMKIQPEPRELFGEPFRSAPQFVYGSPDWDLVLKGFVDFGATDNSDRLNFEVNETLIGIGVGVDFLYKRNLNVRVDWGFAMEELESVDVNSGSNRLHVVATILF